jgi:hypothetical protein
MPFIRTLWVATLTDTREDSGSEDELVIIMNRNGLDVVHRDLGFGDVETGGGKLYRHDIAESQIPPDNYYMRMAIRGSDAWAPRVITAWCERFTSGNVVPLAYEEGIETVLSTDSSEGRVSMPLREVGGGMIRTSINRVLMITATNALDWATDSPVHVRIANGETVFVDHTIPDTSQDDFEGAEGNVYFLPVITPFTRSQLAADSIVLSIEGDDAWGPVAVVMFGLDTVTGNPGVMVPLVHVHPWSFDPLSTDTGEGVASVTLPLAPMDP